MGLTGYFKFFVSILKLCVSKDLGVLNPVWKGQIQMSSGFRDIDF
jgi:hypothetical protein